MIGGRVKLASVASVAAAGLFMGGVAAQAADLGGNCCADLEERVAELEATTARKNNRKVSLTVFGQVNRAVVWHDDSASRVSEVTFRDNDGRSGSRFGFKGSAKINADVSAGFLIEIGVDNNEAAATNNRLSATSSTAPSVGSITNSGGVLFRHTMLYLKSEQLGTIKLGRTNTATEGISEICLGCAITPNSAEEGGSVSALAATTSIDGGRSNGIHYVSPTIGGFVLSASYFHDTDPGSQGDLERRFGFGIRSQPQVSDEGWDVALRYAGEFGAFRLAAGIGYEWTENGPAAAENELLSGSASIMHTPTGIFLQGSLGQNEKQNAADNLVWYISGGVNQKFNSLGKTGLTVGYGEADISGSNQSPIHYGVGVMQDIDAAAMNIYLNWKHYDQDTGANDDVDVVTAGAIIKF